jgi:hypothetical protein
MRQHENSNVTISTTNDAFTSILVLEAPYLLPTAIVDMDENSMPDLFRLAYL